MNICVYAGAKAGRDPEYQRAAAELGKILAEHRIGLIYGGGGTGLMGALADGALAAGGQVTGVMPRFLVDKEIAHAGLADLRIVDSMHDRKRLMAELADGFVALPGGLGTLEELFEMWTWAQLGQHVKPCALLNVAGYYDKLVAFLDRVVEHGFLAAPHRAMLAVHSEPSGILDAFARYEPPPTGKWLEMETT